MAYGVIGQKGREVRKGIAMGTAPAGGRGVQWKYNLKP